MSTDPLAQLRDIHLPEAVGWWPPAPGWWLLTLLFLSALVYAVLWWRQRRARLYFRRQAQRLLEACWHDYEQSGEYRVFLNALLAILKRARLSARDGTARGTPNKSRYADSPSQHPVHAREMLSSTGMFDLLDHSTRGELGRQVERKQIEQLLYRSVAETLDRQQCQALYEAARRYLQQVHRPC